MANRNIYFATCRTGRDFGHNIVEVMAKKGAKTREIETEGITYADGPIQVKFNDPNQVKGKHVYIFQRLVDPFSERPDHYVSHDILRRLFSKSITHTDIENILNTNLADYVRKYARCNNYGSLKQEHINELVERAQECLRGFKGTISELDNDPIHHYPLEGLIRRMIHRMCYLRQLEEAKVTAEGIMQYGGTGATLVVPYLEGRSDRLKYKGEVCLSESWAKELAVHGIKNIVTWRAHSDRQKKFYEKQGISFEEVYENMDQRKMLAQRTVEHLINKGYGAQKIKDYLVVVGPDEGAEPEAELFAKELELILSYATDLKKVLTLNHGLPNSMLNQISGLRRQLGPDYKVPLIIMEKDRGGQISTIQEMGIKRCVNIDPSESLGDKLIINRDDIIDTAGTQDRGLRILGILHTAPNKYKKVGDGTCIMVVDNPILSIPAVGLLEKIKDTGAIDTIIAPNTIEAPEKADRLLSMIQYFDIYHPFAQQIIDIEKKRK